MTVIPHVSSHKTPIWARRVYTPSLHRYLYAYSNPTIYLDPNSNFPVSEGMADALGEMRNNIIDTAATTDSKVGAAVMGRGQA